MRQNKRKIVLATIAVLLAWGAGDVGARTWSVQKDGSGDFWVIQDAVDAAASGDTILIGAGRWYDYQWVNNDVIYTRVISKDLTFIGEGSTVTIIGHENPSFPHPTHGAAFLFEQSCAMTRLEDIGFDMPGFFSWAVANTGARVEIENCRFTRLHYGVYSDGINGGFVRSCDFENVNYNNGGIGVTFYTPARDFVVEHCTFVNCTEAIRADWSGARDIVVQHCTITGGRSGIGFISGATGAVRNCVITGTSIWGIVVHAHGLIEIEDNYVSVGSDATAFGVISGNNGTVALRNNVLESGNWVMYVQSPYWQIASEGNHFLLNQSTGWYIFGANTYSGPAIRFDLSGCWWGTSDAEYIAAHILDGNIDPQKNYFFEFLPIAEGPVPVQQQTWSEIKGLFRD